MKAVLSHASVSVSIGFHASWLRFLWGLRARGLSLAFGVGVSSRPCAFVGCLG